MAADPGPLPTPAAPATYCGHCGDPLADRDHADCGRWLELEPPRYCPACRRRMVVQVTPDAWTARCVDHGVRTADTWGSARNKLGATTRTDP